MNETIEQQERDAKMIVKQITNAHFDTWEEVERAIVMLYIPDMTISRSGISRALEILQRHYQVR